jgi:predicted phage terminase large subunit-like protein
MGLSVYIRKAIEDGKVIFPGKYCQHCTDHANGEKLKCLECLRRSKSAHSYSCTPAETPILMADFTYKFISELQVGDEVIGWKDVPDTKTRPESRMAVSKIIGVYTREAKVNTYTLESGRHVRCTKDHRWYSGRRDKTHQLYREPKIKQYLQYVYDPKLQECPTEFIRDAGWLGGMFDGEGSCSVKGPGIFISQSSTHNPLLCIKIGEILTKLGFTWCYTTSSKSFFIKGGFKEKIRFLQWCKPYRYQKITSNLINNGRRFTSPDKITSVVEGTEPELVYALETTTGNYIAWGYASKNSQYMNDPIDEESVEFKQVWVTHFQLTSELTDKLNHTSAILSIDPAVGTSTINDYTGIAITKILPNHQIYVMEAIQKRMSPEKLIDYVFDLRKAYNVSKVLLETTSSQLIFMSAFKREMVSRKEFFTIEEVGRSTSETKAMRIRGMIPFYANGMIQHRQGLTDLEYQLIQFPRNNHDDIIDALAHQVPYWKKGSAAAKPINTAPYGSLNWWKKQQGNNGDRITQLFGDLIK